MGKRATHHPQAERPLAGPAPRVRLVEPMSQAQGEAGRRTHKREPMAASMLARWLETQARRATSYPEAFARQMAIAAIQRYALKACVPTHARRVRNAVVAAAMPNTDSVLSRVCVPHRPRKLEPVVTAPARRLERQQARRATSNLEVFVRQMAIAARQRHASKACVRTRAKQAQNAKAAAATPSTGSALR